MKKKIKKIRYIFEYAAVITAYFLIRLLPLRALFFLSDTFGAILFFIPSLRNLCLTNLKIAFPEKSDCEIRKIAKKSLQNISKTALELFWFAGKQDYLDKITANKESVLELRTNSQNTEGLILVSAHIGNWELAAFNITYPEKVPFAVIARPQNNPFINDLISRARHSAANVIYEKGAVRAMIKAIKEKIILAILIDQNTKIRDGGAFVNFFNLPVPTSKIVAFFARKMNINVAVVVCLRERNSYKMIVQKLPKKISDYRSDEELTQDIMKNTEELVRQYPEQYLWLYRRWQYIPIDASPELEKKFPYYAQKANPKFYDRTAARKNDKSNIHSAAEDSFPKTFMNLCFLAALCLCTKYYFYL